MASRLNAFSRLNDATQWRSWKDPHHMDSEAIMREVALSQAEYEFKVSAPPLEEEGVSCEPSNA
jgi:hypothetical protein